MKIASKNKMSATPTTAAAARAALEGDGAAPPAQWSVFFMGGSGCSWRDHWYYTVAAAIRAELAVVRCVLCYRSPDCIDSFDPAEMEWLQRFHHPAADDREGGWRARLLRQMGAAGDDGGAHVVVGHSAGANAALRVAERAKLAGLVLVGAGWTAAGRADDAHARRDPRWRAAEPWAVIEPWRFDAVVANVGWVVLLHGLGDAVVAAAESVAIHAGLQAAAARRAAAGEPAAEVVLELPASLAHAQTQQCPEVLEQLLAWLSPGAGGATATATASATPS